MKNALIISLAVCVACSYEPAKKGSAKSANADETNLVSGITATNTVSSTNSCKATKQYSTVTTQVYIGCATNVNGHVNFSDPAGLTEAGCRTFCDSLPNDQCSANPQYQTITTQVYAGCITNVDGHQNFSNRTQLTELGCDTFCNALNGTNS